MHLPHIKVWLSKNWWLLHWFESYFRRFCLQFNFVDLWKEWAFLILAHFVMEMDFYTRWFVHLTGIRKHSTALLKWQKIWKNKNLNDNRLWNSNIEKNHHNLRKNHHEVEELEYFLNKSVVVFVMMNYFQLVKQKKHNHFQMFKFAASLTEIQSNTNKPSSYRRCPIFSEK